MISQKRSRPERHTTKLPSELRARAALLAQWWRLGLEVDLLPPVAVAVAVAVTMLMIDCA